MRGLGAGESLSYEEVPALLRSPFTQYHPVFDAGYLPIAASADEELTLGGLPASAFGCLPTFIPRGTSCPPIRTDDCVRLRVLLNHGLRDNRVVCERSGQER
jgi:hypothetical protein